MPKLSSENDGLNLKLAAECADAFSLSTGVGCTVTDSAGSMLHEAGYGCGACSLCECAGIREDYPAICREAQLYGMAESERFGGKYIYFCPMGLTCFVSPIMGDDEGVAKITVGPLLMVDYEDFVKLDLMDKWKLGGKQLAKAKTVLKNIPYVSPERVTQMSTLLFMSVGFLNSVAVNNRMLDTQDSDAMQGQISDFLMQIKGKNPYITSGYPLEREHELLQCIIDSDKAGAQRLLNELLGHIFFASGGDLSRIKSRVYELLVLTSRAAVDGGADPDYTFNLNHRYMSEIVGINSADELCFWLADVMNLFTDIVFRFADVKHVDVIHKAVQYIRKNYAEKISLEQVAEHVYLSPSYFSKIFREEMGSSFNTYMNVVRIEKSKKLLLDGNRKLVDVASMVGFEDQSYFSKVFKKLTGVAPLKFKDSKGKAKPE